MGNQSSTDHTETIISFPIAFTLWPLSFSGIANDFSDICNIKNDNLTSFTFYTYERYSQYNAYNNFWWHCIGV